MIDGIAALLESLAHLAWIVLAAATICFLLPTLRKLLENGGFSVEGGGLKLSVEKQIKQLNDQVADLMREASTPPETEKAKSAVVGKSSVVNRILWVDDNPANNALYVKQLMDSGVDVVTVKSTADALRILSELAVGAIITDMHRKEGGTDAPVAGLTFLRTLNDRGYKIPTIFMTSSSTVNRYRSQVLSLGGIECTSSPLVLFRKLGEIGILLKHQ
jgi:CheY-like chemotaxis protein